MGGRAGEADAVVPLGCDALWTAAMASTYAAATLAVVACAAFVRLDQWEAARGEAAPSEQSWSAGNSTLARIYRSAATHENTATTCTSDEDISLRIWYALLPSQTSSIISHGWMGRDQRSVLPPSLRISAERLPLDLVVKIAQMLSKSAPRRSIVYMKSACRSWSELFETSGPQSGS